jgi:hypothetical protein
MSCLFKLFRKKQRPEPEFQSVNPLNLDEFPDTRMELEAFEGALVDTLVSIHYRILQMKENIRDAIQMGYSNRARDSIARLTVLKEKKQICEKRLDTVRKKLQDLRVKNQHNQ